MVPSNEMFLQMMSLIIFILNFGFLSIQNQKFSNELNHFNFLLITLIINLTILNLYVYMVDYENVNNSFLFKHLKQFETFVSMLIL